MSDDWRAKHCLDIEDEFGPGMVEIHARGNGGELAIVKMSRKQTMEHFMELAKIIIEDERQD